MDALITLVSVGDTDKDDIKTDVYATVDPVTRAEFESAGLMGLKAQYRFTVWAAEYAGQGELEYNGDRLSIYRTYGARPDDRIELYASERAGNGS